MDDERNILTSLGMALEAELQGAYLQRRGCRARGAERGAGRSGRARHQDATHGGHGAAEPTASAARDVPVIFLTSKDEEVDEVLGLKMGADDYITKPFSQRLVVERDTAVLRRFAGGTVSPAVEGEIMRRGDLILDAARHYSTWKDSPVNLTVTEFLLVQALARRRGIVKSRDQLIDAAYGEHIYVDDRTIDSHIKRLRKKFKDVDGDFAQIETLYGVGYRFKEA